MLTGMGKHRLQPDHRTHGLIGRRKVVDNLFERSFRSCAGCGEDVYVLAQGCRGCGAELELRAG
jgi:hypothetical protein